MNFSISPDIESISKFQNFTGSDIAAGLTLTTLSFLASVIQGSTSLGDGIFLQILWGILQQLVPYVTTESSLGADGLRVITMFMYVRLATMPTTLVFLLWNDRRRAMKSFNQAMIECNKAYGKANDGGGKMTEDLVAIAPDGLGAPTDISKVVSSPNYNVSGTSKSSEIASPPSPSRPNPPEKPPRIISPTLFWLLTIPTIVWSVVGVMIVQRIQSQVLAFYMGSLCIAFSFIYTALRLWKLSSALSSTMPQWLKDVLSPDFSKNGQPGDPGTDDGITRNAKICFFIASNMCGLMTTLAGIGSPPMIIVVLLFNVPVSLTRFTLPVGATFGSFIRLAYALWSGLVTLNLWRFYLPATIMGLVGMVVGVKIGNVLSPSMYAAAIFVLLNLAGMVMLTTNTYVTLPSLIVSTVALVVKHFWFDAAERRRQQQQNVSMAGKANESAVEIGTPQLNSNNEMESNSTTTPSSCLALGQGMQTEDTVRYLSHEILIS